ncbi:MAG: hypothetical protein ABJF23_04360 [Bryobacteraceae bacterium]
MTMEGDGRDKPVRGKPRSRPAGLEMVKRRDPLPLEEQTLYLSLVEELTNEKRPANLREIALVEEIARNYVRLQRARQLEKETLDKRVSEVRKRFTKSLDSNQALAIVFMENAAQLDNMHREEAKIEDAWYRMMAELEREQTERRRREPELSAPAAGKSKRIHLVKPKRD